MKKLKLVLDEDFTYALVRRAYIDGYARPYSKSAEESSYSKMLLERGAQIHIQKEILPVMLLYDEVYIEPFDNFVLEWEDKVIYPSRRDKTGFLKIRDEGIRFSSSESVKKYLEKFPPETILEVITTLLENRYKLNLNKDQLLMILKEKNSRRIRHYPKAPFRTYVRNLRHSDRRRISKRVRMALF